LKKYGIVLLLLFFTAIFGFSQDHFSIGAELLMLNKPAEAVIFLENAVASDPSNVQSYLYLGIVYEQLEKYDEAIAVYRKVMPLAGNFTAVAANNLGNAYFQKGNAGQAEDFYSRAINADSAYAKAYLGRANTRIITENLKGAVSDYEQYLALEPRSSQRQKIEQLVLLIRADFASEERRRILAEEEEKVRLAERQRLLDEVSASLQSAADGSKGISFGTENVESYDNEFELE
jgi:tetratricopeptide (TPR) repeat protein